MIKEIPMLFSTDMVQSILEGRKTVTRRTKGLDVINACPSEWMFARLHNTSSEIVDGVLFDRISNGDDITISRPYRIGHILYVRENYYAYGHWERNGKTKKGNQKWKFIETGNHIEYEGSPISKSVTYAIRDKGSPETNHWYKRLARFMPKTYARIWLEVTGERVERLKNISESDAIKEGIKKKSGSDTSTKFDYFHYGSESYNVDAITSFRTLWEKINGPDSWTCWNLPKEKQPNPWVWVISFKVLSTTGKPKNI